MNIIEETREERIARRFKLGFKNPKKDRWARRLRTKRPIKKPIREYLEDVISTDKGETLKPKLKWYQRLWKWFLRLFKKL